MLKYKIINPFTASTSSKQINRILWLKMKDKQITWINVYITSALLVKALKIA